jgi:predicted enzyme related to lactoylglutathione lyase
MPPVRVESAGGRVLSEPFDVSDAGRMGVFADPAGAVFCVWQSNKHKGAQIVNAAGSWNWSNLNTGDLESSTSFYGAVFGWEFETLDFCGTTTGTVPLSGLRAVPRGVRPRLARPSVEGRAPSGFEDGVAWMAALPRDRSAEAVSSHWSVTFAVADTDAIVEGAVQLGGTVVVLSDPQGAAFTVSRFAPAG